MTQIITIAGRAGAGKDTFAAMLGDCLAQRGRIVSIDRFAAPLKHASMQLFGENSEDREAKEVAREVSRPRTLHIVQRLLQELNLLEPQQPLHENRDIEYLVLHNLAPYLVAHWAYSLSPRRFQQLIGTEVVRTLNEHAWAGRLLTHSRKGGDDYVLVPDYRFQNECMGLPYVVYRPGVERKEHESEALANRLYDHIESSRTRFGDIASPLTTTVEAHTVIWNVADEHLLWLQADALAAQLILLKQIGSTEWN